MRAWCISDGNLWLMDGDSPPEQHESPFAREHVARAERGAAKDAWKHAPGDDDGGGGMISRNMLWGGRAARGPGSRRSSSTRRARPNRTPSITCWR